MASMDWIHHYQLFLFDFDGILVNTEELHYQAYLKMCSSRGFSLPWNQKTYMNYALYSATGVKEGVYKELPALEKEEPRWDVLYAEKKRIYYNLLQTVGPPLMSGVSTLLMALEEAKIRRCVVTHSPREQINQICRQHPVLSTIPHWITREDYLQPKPASECYQKAIGILRQPNDHIIGFEDSPRGLQALLGTEAEAVLVSEVFNQEELHQITRQMVRPFSHFRSFLEMYTHPNLQTHLTQKSLNGGKK
jgi:beta-phosphoglucomutase